MSTYDFYNTKQKLLFQKWFQLIALCVFIIVHMYAPLCYMKKIHSFMGHFKVLN